MKRLHTLSKPLLFAGLLAVFGMGFSSAGLLRAQTAPEPDSLIAGLTERQQAEAERGRRLFDLRFLPVPAEGLPGGGLGPLYMRSNCSACHPGAGRGAMVETTEANLIGGAVFVGRSHPAYGTEIHPRSVPPVPPEGDPSLIWEFGAGEFLDGEAFSLRKPKLTVDHAQYGDPPTDLSLRVGPPLFGLGLLESVPDIEILAWADPYDLNGDGISGRPNPVFGKAADSFQLSRFGWKADRGTLASMNAWAAATFMGLTSATFPEEPCAATQIHCLANTSAGRPDLADGVLRDLTTFVSALKQPLRVNADDPLVLRGQDIFREVNCNACHRERMTTAAAVPGAAYLAGQEIFPYTDLLLHDMGDELDDGRKSSRAASYEWRTAPLWGLSRTVENPGAFGYLHDGRARTLTEAILWHGGEALTSRNAYFVLPKQDRDALIAFLQSL